MYLCETEQRNSNHNYLHTGSEKRSSLGTDTEKGKLYLQILREWQQGARATMSMRKHVYSKSLPVFQNIEMASSIRNYPRRRHNKRDPEDQRKKHGHMTSVVKDDLAATMALKDRASLGMGEKGLRKCAQKY